MFFHWFPVSERIIAACGSEITIPERQQELMRHATCSEFDPAQWVQSAVDLDAKYIVFVAKHGPGVCRWQSQFGEMNFKNAPYKGGHGDPLGELAGACQARGIRLGIYLQGISDTYAAVHTGITRDPSKQGEYTRIYRGWLTEVLRDYGDIVEVWFDGSLVLPVEDVLREYAPDAMVFNSRFCTIRWVGQEEGYASDPVWNAVNRYDAISGVSTQRGGTPNGNAWLPIEVDARLRQSWGFATKDDETPDDETNPLHTVDELINMYYRSVGHGTNLLINHAPNTQGRIPDADMRRMKEFGDEIRRRFGHPLAQGEGEGNVVELDLGAPTAIDHVITMEEIACGQRILSYRISGLVDDEWVTLAGGSAIGHKKIDFFETRTVSKLRVETLKSVGTPLIRSVAAFHVGEIPHFSNVSYGEYKLGEWGSEQYADYVSRDSDMRNQATFRYELGSCLVGAGQYRLDFRPILQKGHGVGDPLAIEDAWVEVDGVRIDGYVTRSPKKENEFIIYNNGETNVVFHAKTKGYTYKDRPRHTGEVLFRPII